MVFSRNLIAFVAASLFSVTATGGTVVCSGKVQTLSYHVNNKLMIRLDSMNKAVFFCSPDSEWSVSGTPYVTGPNTCQTLYSTFLAAKISGKRISSVYFDGDQTPESCNGWGNWKSANVRYFEFDD